MKAREAAPTASPTMASVANPAAKRSASPFRCLTVDHSQAASEAKITTLAILTITTASSTTRLYVGLPGFPVRDSLTFHAGRGVEWEVSAERTWGTTRYNRIGGQREDQEHGRRNYLQIDQVDRRIGLVD